MADAGQWFGFVELAPGAPPLRGRMLAPPPDAVSVVMHVGGGAPGQRSRFDFQLKPDGQARCRSSDALPGSDDVTGIGEVTFDARHLRVPSVELASKASIAPMRPPAFPPDSLIGLLSIDTPQGRVRTYFMADPDQASTAGLQPPEEVQRFADTVYKACNRAYAAEGPAFRR